MNIFFKTLLFTFFVFSHLAYAKMIDAIAIVVEGEPITTAEVKSVQVRMQVSKEKAVTMLIKDRLQKVAMKDIFITENSVDEKISFIAKQNHLTVNKMQKIIIAQGKTWSKYRSTIKKALKKEKFFQTKVASTIATPTEEELKLYYRSHKNKFTLPKVIHLVEYSAPTEKKIKQFLQTKNTNGIKSKTVSKETSDLDETLIRKFLQTQDGSFTRPLNAGDRYITYKVLSKEGQSSMSFEIAKGMVTGMWKQNKQKKALKDYFEKLKTNADIQRIR